MSAIPKTSAPLFAILLGFSLPGPGIAQSLRDEVEDHVEKGLEKAKQDAKRKKDAGEKKPSAWKSKAGDKKKPAEADDPDDEGSPADTEVPQPPPEPGSGEVPEPVGVPSEPTEAPSAGLESQGDDGQDPGEPAGLEEGAGNDAPTVTDDTEGAIEGTESTAPRLPRRVFGKNFQLDLEAAAGYRGWTPQQYPAVAVEMGNYFTWSVSARAKFFDTVSLKRGYYESTNATSPRDSYVADAAKYGSYALKAAWFLAELGIPALESWEPAIRYEARSFATRARPDDGAEVCVIPFDTDADTAATGCTPATGPLTVVSGFETAALGVRYYPTKNPTSVIDDRKWAPPSLFLGAGYLSYLKPYQVTIGELVLDRYLFSGRFYGGGLALGGEIGGGVNHPYIDVWAQLGLGRVRLTQDMTLNELAPEDWMIGYVQGNLQVSYRWAPFAFAPSILVVPSGTVSGASFFFFETDAEEGEETATPSINWDVLYSVQLALVITL